MILPLVSFTMNAILLILNSIVKILTINTGQYSFNTITTSSTVMWVIVMTGIDAIAGTIIRTSEVLYYEASLIYTAIV